MTAPVAKNPSILSLRNGNYNGQSADQAAALQQE